ncbi:MAG: hypothetical protein C4583_08860 [Anaerolineaceae bacterium]|nr:MAG: hypothetical protein C4583_08860 [Anaerolineaceae bacterium]
MNIRALDLLDLPTLSRYRNDALLLDSTRAFTRSNPLGAAGFLSHFNPARHVYTAIAKDNGDSLLGCVIHAPGETFARLLYLAPSSLLTHPSLIPLIENLSAQAGTWGAFHVIAEVDETSEAFPALRNAGFAVYAWQRLWELSSVTEAGSKSEWKRARDVDLSAIQSLYHQIVPPLLQPVELLSRRADGFICNEGVKCHVGVSSGTSGIVLSPLIHPDTENVGAHIAALTKSLPSSGTRPVYMCVRSYQAWLEPVLEDLGALAGPRQAVMVKHLARVIKDEQAVKVVQPASVSVQPSRVSRIEGKK